MKRPVTLVECILTLILFGILPFFLYGYAESRFGITPGASKVNALLLSIPIAALVLLKAKYKKGTPERFILSIAQIFSVCVWIFVGITPVIPVRYGEYDIVLTLVDYLILLSSLYALNAVYACTEYIVYRSEPHTPERK